MLTDRPKKGHPKKDQERASVQVMKIEREKYQLLEQIKTYQEKISQQETQSRRMEKRYEQMVKHISAFEEKLKESRSERKTLQKQIIYIVQFVDRIVHKLCRFNKSFVDCFVKALENLLFKKSFDFESSLKFMDRNAIRESFFDYLKTLKLTKIDFNKVKRSMVRAQNKVPGYDTSEGIKALESLYDKLSEQIGNSKFDISKKDISEILGQFQSHKMLLRRNSDLLSRRSAMEESSIEFGFNKHPQAPSATMGCPSYGSSFVVPAESMNQSMSSFMDVSNFKSSILSLNTSTMSLLENREETAELMSIYENLEEKKDDFDLKLKLASKRTSKLKREVERANSTLEVKRGELRAVQAQGEKLEGDFERVLAELEDLEINESIQNDYMGNIRAAILKVKQEYVPEIETRTRRSIGALGSGPTLAKSRPDASSGGGSGLRKSQQFSRSSLARGLQQHGKGSNYAKSGTSIHKENLDK